MNKNLLIVITVIAVFAIAGVVYTASRNETTESPTPSQEDSTAVQTTPTPTLSVTENPTTSESATTEEKTVTVNLTASGYSPASITVSPGTKVIWTNNSGGPATVDSDPHPVHTSYRPLNLESFADGETHELVFTEPGTYRYHDHFHPNRTGTVIVK